MPLGRVAFRTSTTSPIARCASRASTPASRRSVLDAAGNVVEARDGKGALVLRAYDALNRPIRSWARDGAGQPLTLARAAGLRRRRRTRAMRRARNLLGRLYRHYDEAGLLAVDNYDFKGNVLEKSRRIVATRSCSP